MYCFPGCKVVRLKINFPIESEDQVVNIYREKLANVKTIKVAILGEFLDNFF